MWPQKDRVGARISYGVNGNALIQAKSTTNEGDDRGKKEEIEYSGDTRNAFPKPIFPRQQYGARAFSMQAGSLETTIDTTKLSTYDALPNNSSLSMKLQTGLVPRNMLSSLSVESRAFDTKKTYIPNTGETLNILQFYLRNSSQSIKASVYATGETSSTMRISTIKEDNTHSFSLDMDFRENIEQIEVSQCKPKGKENLVLVRTTNRVYLCLCKVREGNSHHRHKHLKLKVNILQDMKLQSPQSHLTFCKRNCRKFASIDHKGLFTVYQVSDDLSDFQKTFEVLLDLANIETNGTMLSWINLCWPKDKKRILISTRTNIYEFEWKSSHNFRTLITSNTWSRIHAICSTTKFVFILTSKELIWVSYRKRFQRLLSWKHYLMESDPTKKMTLLENGNNFHIFLTSQISPIIIVYTFGLIAGRPCSLVDPYLIDIGARLTRQLKCVWNNEKKTEILLLHTLVDNTMSTCLLTSEDFDNSTMQTVPNSTSSPNSPMSFISKDNSRIDIGLFKKTFTNIKTLSIKQNSAEVSASTTQSIETKMIFEIQQLPSTSSHGTYSSIIYQLKSVPFHINYLPSFDKLIESLNNGSQDGLVDGQRSFRFKNFIYTALETRGAKSRAGPQETKSFLDLFHSMTSNNSDTDHQAQKAETAICLGTSLIKYREAEQPKLETEFQETKTNSNQQVQMILDAWDEPVDQVQESPVKRRKMLSTGVTDSVPVLRASQTVTQHNLYSSQSFQDPYFTQSQPLSLQEKHENSQSQFGLSQRSSQRPSQASSQRSIKKKKKKKGGF